MAAPFPNGWHGMLASKFQPILVLTAQQRSKASTYNTIRSRRATEMKVSKLQLRNFKTSPTNDQNDDDSAAQQWARKKRERVDRTRDSLAKPSPRFVYLVTSTQFV